MRIRKALIALAIVPVMWTATAAHAAVTSAPCSHSQHYQSSSDKGVKVWGNGFLQFGNSDLSTTDTAVPT